MDIDTSLLNVCVFSQDYHKNSKYIYFKNNSQFSCFISFKYIIYFLKNMKLDYSLFHSYFPPCQEVKFKNRVPLVCE